MKVGTIQKSYGFGNSGAIYMSVRELIEWCFIIGRNIIQLAKVITDRKGIKINKYAHTFVLGNITFSEKKIAVGLNDDVLACKQAEDLFIKM